MNGYGTPEEYSGIEDNTVREKPGGILEMNSEMVEYKIRGE